MRGVLVAERTKSLSLTHSEEEDSSLLEEVLCVGRGMEWTRRDITGDIYGTGNVERDRNLILSEEEDKLLLWEVEEEDR